jgi:hypothetical protein
MKIKVTKYGEIILTSESDEERKQMYKVFKKIGGNAIIPADRKKEAYVKLPSTPIRFVS